MITIGMLKIILAIVCFALAAILFAAGGLPVHHTTRRRTAHMQQAMPTRIARNHNALRPATPTSTMHTTPLSTTQRVA